MAAPPSYVNVVIASSRERQYAWQVLSEQRGQRCVTVRVFERRQLTQRTFKRRGALKLRVRCCRVELGQA